MKTQKEKAAILLLTYGYEAPSITVWEVKVEKGFACSDPLDPDCYPPVLD
ncbi:MAG: hypothetical protein LBD45_06195 [Bacteroidales bacterium]|jgi:hypothetical protein|nr:hypothetical protein [Bacteroidales bacterium]